MPALPIAPGVLKVGLHFADQTDPLTTVGLHWRYTGGPPSGADCAAIATAINAAAEGHLVPLFSSAVTYSGSTVTDVGTVDGAVGDAVAAVIGTLAGEGLNTAQCALINHKIARHYRGGRPRSYTPFGSHSSWLSGSTWEPQFQTLVNGGWAAFVAAVSAITEGTTILGAFCSVSYYSGPNTSIPPWRGPGHPYPPKLRDVPHVDNIISSSLAAKFSSQRRRYQR
jgi:hypothetical protein